MFGSNPNTIPLATKWELSFQVNHYKVPVFPIIAREKLAAVLTYGQTVKRTYSSDGIAGDMGGNGSYVTTAAVNTEESLTINTKKYFATQWPSWEKLLWHLENDAQYREKAIRRLINQTDADILAATAAGALNTMDNGNFGGTSGQGFVPTNGNVFQAFGTANELLRLANTDYPNNVPYTGNVKIDMKRKMKVAVVDPHTANLLEQYLGTKNSKLGDDVSNEGFVQMFNGFNVFTSNNLPFVFSITQVNSGTFTNNDTFVIGGVTLTAVNSIGSTAGNFLITGTWATDAAALATSLAAPFTTTSTFVALTATQINTTAKALIWGLPGGQGGTNLTAAYANSALTITVTGVTKISVSTTSTTVQIPTNMQYTQTIFCISKCIDLVMKRSPSAEWNPVSGQIAKDLVVWNLYDKKVFHDQAPMIVACNINTSGVTAPTQVF